MLVDTDLAKCRVCGLNNFPFLPWGESGTDPTHDICSCCGVQAGYGDHGVENCIAIRKHWIRVEGGQWSSPRERPPDWDLPSQIRGIPAAYRSPDDESLIEEYIERSKQPPAPPTGFAALSAIEKRED